MAAGAARLTPAILPLVLERVSWSAGPTPLLNEVSITIDAGRRLVVMGPNGAGKSLLLRLCHGLIEPTGGRIRWASGEARPKTQAMVLQRPVLLRRTAAENLDYPLALRRLPEADRREIVAKSLARFGLEPLATRPARRLSGGEQQRLALARAWAMRPQILFLDEPSSALDPAATRLIEEAIAGFSADGITIVMTTHDLGQARRLAEDVAFLHRGRLVEQGTAAAFFTRPQSPEARAFVAGDLVC